MLKPIKITKRTRYKIKNQQFIDKLFEDMPEEVTICGMKFHRNTATTKPCYFYQEGFGKRVLRNLRNILDWLLPTYSGNKLLDSRRHVLPFIPRR